MADPTTTAPSAEEVVASTNTTPETLDLVQIVQEDYSFNPTCKDQMEKFSGNFYASGLDYNVVSILGPQSGGKSTLLNLLFNVNFKVMDEEHRQQTTKGLWLAHDDNSKSLIMDVEGSDSRERGENHIKFERKSALFSLAISEVLIINMWTNDVGRYQAANYETLRTVFEIHLKLFYTEGSPKTLLLFILRDHQSTPLVNLSNILRKDMDDMWVKLDKPENLKDTKFSDFFDAEFTSLPNYVFQKDAFMDQVSTLSKRFTDNSREDYLYKPVYSKQVPADGFPEYSGRIWETILAERDLDLPSVKEMLARVRCDEIAQAVMASTRKEFESYKRALSDGEVVKDLGTLIAERVSTSLQTFKEKGSIYHEPTYLERREQLIMSMDEYFSELKDAYARNVVIAQTRTIEEHFQAELTPLLASGRHDMWTEIGQVYTDTLLKGQADINQQFAEMGFSEDFTAATLQKFNTHTVELAEKQIKHSTHGLKETAVKRFEKNFKYDENKIPREWGKDDNVPEAYTNARNKVVDFIGLFTTMTLPQVEGSLEATNVQLLKPTQVDALQESIDELIKPIYEDALRTQKRTTSGAPPVWLIVVFLVLGFNEFMAFLDFVTTPSNMVFVLFAVSMAGTVYALHHLGLMGPAESVARKAVEEVSNQAQDGLLMLTEKLQDASAKRRKKEE
ncbi:hypothetical protein SARC_03909 [Sphaeroforma arctica JP610]|uniref:GB1/RHD3-type G domain-containing protein n=1 Tax=Sphaeroforma arctica JP610 TaxID=667725 RepID=A0A0L0G414_9EUKA|nr:hypothetical protein SARC_03909 [Sphaeroforma arctica JP610]KNC83852.1 hypothetical protein SARC_03909 [Sphaeroforma arctica JP610]|eukprot:XP_014157754.1 hypothetical protein SARC_03909 [Sphaeroforma arctica JP610]